MNGRRGAPAHQGLERWDDLPVHQTPAPLAVPATDEPRTYERYWFAAASTDGAAMIGLVVTVHPVVGTIDAAFSVSDGDRAETLFVTDALRHGREDLVAGPVRLTLVDPMRVLRIRVDGRDGFAADVVVTATTPAITEDRVTRVRDGAVVQDRTRYVQLGSVAGSVRSPLGAWTLDPVAWRAGRDHSWGVQEAARPAAGPAGETGARPSFFWLIGAFDDVAVQAVTHAEADGTRYGEYAAVAPTLATGADVVGPGARQQARPVRGVTVARSPGTRRVATARLALGGGHPEAPDDVLSVTSHHVVLPRSVGYGHPTRVPGSVPPDRPVIATESWTIADLDPTAPENHRSLQFARLDRADGGVGWAFIDQSG
ncbi:hypothetical protein [Curtobacterium sp. MCBD17_028]|uniref:hypothetical protein n=1 Tax=Curtobacterium sp. MCBD17_028 TaxID=2175670 RepID=UPI000DAA70F1|nr:hypothetical protein [Curtobacterium sp. MCBD17_028]PZE27325.1 hypothetical protein DEI86_07525 [Curtobacterium sp. MCBD17_028]